MAFEIENGVLKNYTEEPGVTEIVVPEGVTVIGERAFFNCKSLTSITIPDSVTEIDWGAFSNCASLTSVALPDSVTKIGYEAFSSCKSLTSITIPDSVTKIGYKAFSNCESLTSITIPDSVTEIGEEAFSSCKSLTNVTIPESVTEIASNAFSGTPWLENDPNDLVIVGNGMLYKYKGSGDITIPDSVTKIGKMAFSYTSVERVVIENETIKICESAFSCAYSFRIIVFPKGMDKIDYKWFDYYDDVNPVGIVITCLFRTVGVLNKKIKNFNEVERKNFAADLIEFIKANIEVKALKDTNLSKAADYILDHPDDFSKQQIEEFLTAAKKKKSEKAIEVVEAYYNTLGVEENTSYPEFREIFKESSFDAVLRNCPEAVKIMSRVQFADGNSVDDVYIVKCAVMPYYLQVKPLEKRAWGYNDSVNYYNIDSNAEKAASYLDKSSLAECVGYLYKKYGNVMFGFIVPLGRYGTDEQVEAIISDLNRWESDRYLRNRCTTARGAVFISQSKPAILYFEKWQKGSFFKRFEEYAYFHKTTIDDLRERIFADIGLDKDGVHIFDLGGKTVKAVLGSDLKISLTDESNGKTVKSLPKKGANPELHAAAAADIKKMRADLKKIVKERNKLFFEDFLVIRSL